MSGVLIDTQALIWFAEGSSALSSRGRATIDDPSILQFASVASFWEMAIKTAVGNLTLKSGSLRQFAGMLDANGIRVLPILADEAIDVAALPKVEKHKDPFDRLIAAQCLRYDFALVSIDAVFDAYGVRRIW